MNNDVNPNKSHESFWPSLEKVDRLVERLPIISTIASLVNLILKATASKKPEIHNHHITYLKEKSYARSLTLLVPFIGNIIVAILDSVRNKWIATVT